jgi:hypothetical protein
MWRYKLILLRLPSQQDPQASACEAELNVLGGEGWEAVAVVQQTNGWCWVILKMPHQVGTY